MSIEAQARPWVRTGLLVAICFFAADLTAAQIEKSLMAGAKANSSSTVKTSMTRSNVALNGLANAGDLQFVLNNTAPVISLTNSTMVGLTPGVPVPTPGAPPPQPLPKLTGTLAGSGHSLAVLQSGEDTRVVGIGEEVNGYTVKEVGQYTAVLTDKAGQTYNLSMDLAQAAAPPVATAPAVTNTITPPRSSMLPGNGTRMPPATPLPDGTMSVKELREMMADYQKFIGHIQIKPIQREGEPVGMQLNYNTPDNPFAKLGVSSGDLITSMNNHPLKGPDDLMWIYQELRNATELNFQLERNGAKIPLSVHLVE